MTQRPRTRTFKRLVKLVLICTRLCQQSLHKLSRLLVAYESVLHDVGDYDAKLSWRGLTFRSQDFKAGKQNCEKIGARRQFELEPPFRSEEDISQLLVVLRDVTAFAEYPKKVQLQMCKVGRFECYERRRVIVREAEKPQSLYFILSGAVLATSNENVQEISGTLMTLTKGMMFDERAVISDTSCRTTFCTQTEVELFSIASLDFRKIFTAGEQNMLANEKQKQFIRRNQVVIRDSNDSAYIYIVLKGSLSVMKKLKPVRPAISRKRQTVSYRELAQGYIARKKKARHIDNWSRNVSSDISSKAFSLDKKKSSRGKLSSSQQETYRSVHELEAKLQETLPGYHNHADRCGCLDYNKIISNFNSRLLSKGQDGGHPTGYGRENCSLKGGNHNTKIDSPNERSCHDSEEIVSLAVDDHTKEQPCSLPNIAKNNYVIQNRLGVSNDSHHVIKKDIDQKKEDDDLEQASIYSNDKTESSKSLKTLNLSKSLKGVYLTPNVLHTEKNDVDTVTPYLLPEVTDLGKDISEFQANNVEIENKNIYSINRQLNDRWRVLDRLQRKEIVNDLDHQETRNLSLTESDSEPMVVELQVLERGQYFGLASFLFTDQPNLLVISNGAECLVLPKKLFLQWASEKCLRHLRQTECPYPSDLELHLKLQEIVNWKAIRSVIYHHVVEKVRRKKENRKQFVLNYQGQYCFRTGPT